MFKIGNNHSLGRPKGSSNKTTAETKSLLSDVVFNREQFTNDWHNMNAHERMEIRIKLAKYLIPEAKISDTPIENHEEFSIDFKELLNGISFK